jgi:hypothetical protein
VKIEKKIKINNYINMCVDKKITSQMVILMMQQKIIVMDLTELVTLDLIEVIIMVLFG